MPPFVRPRKPLSGCRLALVTTGGVHLPADTRFDIDDPSGDCSYREIPAGATDLTWTHAYYRPDEGTDLDSARAFAQEPAGTPPSQAPPSAARKPRSMSVWILPAARRAVERSLTVHALHSFSLKVKNVMRPSRRYAALTTSS